MRDLTQEEYDAFIEYIRLNWDAFYMELIVRCRCGNRTKKGVIDKDKAIVRLCCAHCQYIFCSFLTVHMEYLKRK